MKTVELYNEGIPRLRQQFSKMLEPHFRELTKWPIQIQLFVRADRRDDLGHALEGRIDKQHFKIITLEETLQRWKPDYGV